MESKYWLKIIKAIIPPNFKHSDELDNLINESNELNKILGSISLKTKKN